MLSDKQFLFIVGSPRSGTTWLQIMISAHPLVCTTVELTLFSRYTAPWIKAWKAEAANIERERWYQGLPFLWTEDDFYGFLREFLGKVYERVAASNPQATHILDKHPGYSMCIEDINRLLPNARFIHVIRDGRDVVVSMVAARKQIGFGTGSIEDSAVQWKRYVRAAQKARQYHDRYLEVRYEDLSSSGVDTIKSIFDFCGLPASDEDMAAIVTAHQFERMKAKGQAVDKRIKKLEAHYRKGKIGSWKEELVLKKRYVFHKIAGDLLCELGYADNSWWIEEGYQRFTLPLLSVLSEMPAKVIRATANLVGPQKTTRIKAMLSRNRAGW